jgi:hypothetical protein
MTSVSTLPSGLRRADSGTVEPSPISTNQCIPLSSSTGDAVQRAARLLAVLKMPGIAGLVRVGSTIVSSSFRVGRRNPLPATEHSDSASSNVLMPQWSDACHVRLVCKSLMALAAESVRYRPSAWSVGGAMLLTQRTRCFSSCRLLLESPLDKSTTQPSEYDGSA